MTDDPKPIRARKIPATRKPSAGRGQGPGWGGPASGSVRHANAPFASGNHVATFVRMDRAERKALREARAEHMEDVLYRLATSAEREETQVSAASKLHAIYEGQPVARNLNASVDDVGSMNDRAILDELARLSRETASAFAPVEKDTVPSEPGGVVH